MNLEHIVLVLQMSIGPMIVISGAGLVLLSMTNRFGRVIDRIRILAQARRSAAGGEGGRIGKELRILMRRAIAFASTSVLVAASLVIVLFLAVVLQLDAAMLVIVMFILCMGFLITSLIFFIADVNVSLAALALEMDGKPHGRGDV